MYTFITWIVNFWVQIIDLFNDRPIEIAGREVSFFGIIFAFLVIGFAISYFWKGARA